MDTDRWKKLKTTIVRRDIGPQFKQLKNTWLTGSEKRYKKRNSWVYRPLYASHGINGPMSPTVVDILCGNLVKHIALSVGKRNDPLTRITSDALYSSLHATLSLPYRTGVKSIATGGSFRLIHIDHSFISTFIAPTAGWRCTN